MQAINELNATLLPVPVPSAAPVAIASIRMHAIVHREYGATGVLKYEEVERPIPGDNDVLVRVRAAGASIGDHHIVSGLPYMIRITPFGGLPGPKNRVPGAAMAGTVESVGAKVTTFRAGDEVFGQAANGAFAQYVVVPAEHIAPKPINVSFEEAAAVPWGATALMGLRDAAGLKAGQRVLINGASGGVGTWAVQIAKALGAHVTAVCGTRHVEMVRALGADEVIDYTRDDFAQAAARYDVMMDLVGNRSLSDCWRVLTPKGVFVPCSGGGGDWFGPLFRVLGVVLRSLFTGRKVATFVMAPKQSNLLFLKDLVESGKAKPVIDRRYPLSEVVEALEHVGEGHAHGQTVIHT